MLVFDLLSLSCVWEGVFPLERHNHVHNIGLGFGLIEDDEVWLKDSTYHPAPSVRGTACFLLGELLWQPGGVCYCGVLGLAEGSGEGREQASPVLGDIWGSSTITSPFHLRTVRVGRRLTQALCANRYL